MIAKFIFKALVVAVILFGMGTYMSYLVTGKTPSIMDTAKNLPKLNLPEIKKSISRNIDSIKGNENKEETIRYLYKWRDDKGVIHYTSEKPVGIKNVETITYYDETNVLPAVNQEKETNNIPDSNTNPATLSAEIPENIYSPEGIKQLINQAKDVQNLLNEQYSNQENLSNKN